MSAGSEQAGQGLQPESVLRWSVAPETTLWTPDAEVASQAAHQLAETFFPAADQAGEQTADPLNAELFRIDPDAKQTSVNIWTPVTEETGPNTLDFELSPQTDGAVTVNVIRHPKRGGSQRKTITEALAGIGAVLQAPERSLDIDFPTGETALKYLESPGVSLPKDVVTNYVRRLAFDAITRRVAEYARSAARTPEGSFPDTVEQAFTLVRRHAPQVSDDLAALKGKIEARGPHINDFDGTFMGLARQAYFDLRDEGKRKRFLEETASLLRTLHEDDIESGKDWPQKVAFHPRYDPYTLRGSDLAVRFAWTGELVDPRISVAATLFIKGEYDLSRHNFAVKDSGVNPHTHIRLAIRRGTDSPLHGEQELAPIMERQWRQLGGTALTDEQLAAYQQEFTQPAAAVSDPLPRSQLQVRWGSGEPVPGMHPVDDFFM